MSTTKRADVEIASRTTSIRTPSRWKFRDRCGYEDVATITCHDQEMFENLFSANSSEKGSLSGFISLKQIKENILPVIHMTQCPRDLLDEVLVKYRTPSEDLLPTEDNEPVDPEEQKEAGERTEEKVNETGNQDKEISGESEAKEGDQPEVSIELSVDSSASTLPDGTKRRRSKSVKIDEFVYTWDNFRCILENTYAPSYVFGKLLNRACARADMKTIQELLFRGCNPNDIDGRGMTPIHYAAERGCHDVIKEINEIWIEEVNIDKPDHRGWTPFITAASRGHFSTCQVLRSMGAEVNAQTLMGRSALHWAATKGYEPAVSALMKEKVDRNLRDSNGWTALHCAVINGDFNIIRILLEGGVDPKIKDKCDRTAKSYCTNEMLEMYDATMKKLRKSGSTNKKKK